jgi:hypothetical protein
MVTILRSRQLGQQQFAFGRVALANCVSRIASMPLESLFPNAEFDFPFSALHEYLHLWTRSCQAAVRLHRTAARWRSPTRASSFEPKKLATSCMDTAQGHIPFYYPLCKRAPSMFQNWGHCAENVDSVGECGAHSDIMTLCYSVLSRKQISRRTTYDWTKVFPRQSVSVIRYCTESYLASSMYSPTSFRSLRK